VHVVPAGNVVFDCKRLSARSVQHPHDVKGIGPTHAQVLEKSGPKTDFSAIYRDVYGTPDDGSKAGGSFP
jgi:hypothetical protein